MENPGYAFSHLAVDVGRWYLMQVVSSPLCPVMTKHSNTTLSGYFAVVGHPFAPDSPLVGVTHIT